MESSIEQTSHGWLAQVYVAFPNEFPTEAEADAWADAIIREEEHAVIARFVQAVMRRAYAEIDPDTGPVLDEDCGMAFTDECEARGIDWRQAAQAPISREEV